MVTVNIYRSAFMLRPKVVVLTLLGDNTRPAHFSVADLDRAFYIRFVKMLLKA